MARTIWPEDIVALGTYARRNLLGLSPILRSLGLGTTPESRQDVSGLEEVLDRLWELDNDGPAREEYLEEKPEGRSVEAYLEAVKEHLQKDVKYHSGRLADRLNAHAEGTWRA